MTAGRLRRLPARSAITVLLTVLACNGARGGENIDSDAVREIFDSGEYAAAMETATDLLTLDSKRGDILNVLVETQLAVCDL